MSRILFEDLYPLFQEDEIAIQVSNYILEDIANQLGYDVETFAVQMEDEFGFHISPNEYVDLAGLAIFIDDIGLDSDTFFDDYEVIDIRITDSEDSSQKVIGLIFAQY